MTEQEQVSDDNTENKDVITYIKTDNDVEISVAQLAEDPKKLSIDDGRWIIDIPKKFAICLSEEFEQSVMSCTHYCKSEWGGYVVGHDIKWTNPENNRQVRILIALRAIVIAQSRTGASVEIKQKETEEWMDSDDDESPMAFKTVFAKNRWQKIGWVHSHADFGTFWSKTDTDTIADMRGVPCLLSIVYSREGKDKISRRVRVDVNDVLFGGKYNLFMDEINDSFIYSEGDVQKLGDVPKDVQEYYKSVISNTKIVETESHHTTSTKTTIYDGRLSGFRGVWSDCQDAYYTDRRVLPTTEKTEQISKHAIVTGNLSEKAKDEVIEFSKFHYSLPQNVRKNLTISDFFILLDSELAMVLKPDGFHQRWKMKDAVNVLDKQQILNIIAYYTKSEIQVRLATEAYHNFKYFTLTMIKELSDRLDSNETMKIAVVAIAGDNWFSQIEKSFNMQDAVDIQIDDAEEVVEEVVKEVKPTAYIPDEKFIDWRDFYLYLPKKYKDNLWDTVFNGIDVNSVLCKKILERGEVAIKTELRGDEDRYLEYAAIVYENFVDMWKKAPKKYKDAYRNFYASYYRATFDPFFSQYTYYNNPVPKLQKLLNAIDEEYAKQFINDFIVMYETEEELEEIVKKFPSDFKIYKQTFKCSICGNVWILKEDADSCEIECEKRGKVKTDKVLEVEAKEQSKKESSPPTHTTTIESGGETTIGSKMSDFVYGVPISYFEAIDVCSYCGTLYTTAEAAELCEDDCSNVIDDVKVWLIDKDDMYICGFCGDVMNDEESVLDHVTECKEYGVLLDYLINLMNDVDNKIDDVITLIHHHFLNKQGTPAPFIDWMLDADRAVPHTTCKICGKFWENKYYEMKDVLLTAYAHERYCQFTDTEKTNVVRKSGAGYRCGSCEEHLNTPYTYWASTLELIQIHLYSRHGLYPTLEQLEKNVKEEKDKEYSGVNVMGSTKNTVLMDDGFACIHCTALYLTPDGILKHLTNEHKKNILVEEYLEWSEHYEGACDSRGVDDNKNLEHVTQTLNTSVYNGIIVCKYCDVATMQVYEMKEHLYNMHKVEMLVDEETLIVQTVESTEKVGVVSNVDFGDLENDFGDWLDLRMALEIPYNICQYCGLEFNLEYYNNPEDSAVMRCFHHELECDDSIDTTVDKLKCAICGTLYSSELEREICEIEHLELD